MDSGIITYALLTAADVYLLRPGGMIVPTNLLPFDDTYTHILLVGAAFYAEQMLVASWSSSVTR